tara:strand:+ start:26246 stop:26782 length:537 start_codon:yes stop_codon:yes gene_type:complete
MDRLINILENEKSEKSKVYIYSDSSFNLNSEIGGSIEISHSKFTELFEMLKKKLSKFKTIIINQYNYHDLTMDIDQEGKVSVYKNVFIGDVIDVTFLAIVKQEVSVSVEYFPSLDLYHSKSKKIIKSFYWMPITVDFIEETYDDENKIYYIQYSFNNHCEKSKWLLGKLQNILKITSS